jgi:ketosteroid isomerase-like protein
VASYDQQHHDVSLAYTGGRIGRVVELSEFLSKGEQAVSQESLDVMRQWVGAWNSRDLSTFAQLFDADAEVITDPAWMEPGPFRGRGAIITWFEGLQGSWDAEEVVLRELFEAGERVLARIDWEVRGRTSGIETKLDATSINTIRDGRILRQEWYFDHDAALRSVGRSHDRGTAHSGARVHPEASADDLT